MGQAAACVNSGAQHGELLPVRRGGRRDLDSAASDKATARTTRRSGRGFYAPARGDRRTLPRSANRGAAPADTAADQWFPLVSVFLNLNKPKICFLTREK
jgi:hypothetical protein